MNILSPSILAADGSALGEEIRKVAAAGAGYLHIDVMDGVFVPSISYGVCTISSIRKVCDIIFDVHLMIVEPDRYLEDFAKAGADIITVHLEACKDPGAAIDKIHSLGCRAGISIKPGTPVEAVERYLPELDLLLIMTVEPGFGGQKYMQASTERIRQACRMIKEKGLSMDVEVDGGITRENVSVVLEAGANVIVAGSAVFTGDSEANVKEFLRILEK